MNYLCLDVGTTGCKSQLFSDSGEILNYIYCDYDFKTIDGKNYINVEELWLKLKNMIGEVAKKFTFDSIAISSLGESFVLLDGNDNILFYPMLYTDNRGEKEAEYIKKVVGEKKAFNITGVMPHSMYSIAKLLYIKNNYPDIYCKGEKLLLVGDYIGYLLTGKRVIDYALASRTGVLDIEKKEFSKQILNKLGVDLRLFSTPKRAGSIVGELKSELKAELNIKNNPLLILGSHDQVCNAMGAGVISSKNGVDGLGTVECITTVFDKKPSNFEMAKCGYPVVPYALDGLYCTYILNFSCGSTINWLKKKIIHGYCDGEKDFFTYIEKGMNSEPTGLLLLPYFGGASTPYQDLNAKGAILNLTTQTTDSDIYKSVMEGSAMEMRLNLDFVKKYGIDIDALVVTGGGANSLTWLQIKADIEDVKLKSLRSSEGGLCGLAVISALALDKTKNIEQIKNTFVRYGEDVLPNNDSHNKYQKYYEKYKKLYKLTKEIN